MVFEIPFGRSLLEDGTIQLDSLLTDGGEYVGGVLPSSPRGRIPRSALHCRCTVASLLRPSPSSITSASRQIHARFTPASRQRL